MQTSYDWITTRSVKFWMNGACWFEIKIYWAPNCCWSYSFADFEGGEHRARVHLEA
jgi:hypothetical protein